MKDGRQNNIGRFGNRELDKRYGKRACRITVTGLVQGIGFRPFIAEMAEELGLVGQVRNLGGVVEIIIDGNRQAVDSFIHRLESLSENGKLPGSRIDELKIVEDVTETSENWEKFHIVESDSARERRRFLPVDLPTCDCCMAEMHDPKNRRYRYPFISCTACGPRFSIQTAVPYDRETITMNAFPMCEACAKEYTQKGNIRRHAQTIACPDCGPRLRYIDRNYHEESDMQQALALATEALQAGKIGAIKDIGGFHFAFSPMNSEAANRLRKFKNRDKKPFAVMFPDVESMREYCEVSEKEEELLLSSARPIVLLQKKKDFVPEICGESDRIGALLPCNPLQILLLEETGPLVMTSGNRGGEPIIIDDAEMLPYLGEGGIDFMLTHDREILTPLDDSIYQVVAWSEHEYTQLIRRARGLVPEPIALSRKLNGDIFAAGGDLKAAFALGRDNLAYMSQYFGDLEEVQCLRSRARGRERMEHLLDIHPQMSVTDLHPAYVSVQEEQKGSIGLRVQHHHAHIASVIAEHGLEGKVLGIACDGTGYGTDGTIWGGEFLLCEDEKMTRVGHLSSVKLVGGDASAKQADMTLYSYILEARQRGLTAETPELSGESTQEERAPLFLEMDERFSLQAMAWKQNINTVYSSSMGRLFDAVAALLDICHENSYEGECAIKLEQAAHEGRREYKQMLTCDGNRLVKCEKIAGIWQLNTVQLLIDLYSLKPKHSKELLAYLFHHALAEGIVELAEHILTEHSVAANNQDVQISATQREVNQVALSGGSFINRILLEEVITGLERNGHEVFINEKVPCGDGGIALGQMYLATFAR